MRSASPAARRAGILRLAALAAVVAAIVALARFAPTPAPRGPDAALPFAFPEEPVVRVRIKTLEPGAVATLRNVARAGAEEGDASAAELRNVDGLLRVDGRPTETPAIFRGGAGGVAELDRLRYRGVIRVTPEPGRPNLLVVNDVPLETYLEGVLLSEMSAKFPEEALRAQAVASRGYAAAKALAMRRRPFDVTDTQASQVYRGAPDRGRALAARLVRETRGLALTFEGRVLETVFSSTCGGTTRSATEAFGDAAPAPLCGVPCGRCDGSEFATWSCRAKRSALGRALELGGPVDAIEDVRRLPSDRVGSVFVRAGRGGRRVGGSELRAALGDKALSIWFTRLALEGDSVVVEGRGYGHGAGLCQVGARTLANAGEDWRAILARYYPGAVVARLYPVSD